MISFLIKKKKGILLGLLSKSLQTARTLLAELENYGQRGPVHADSLVLPTCSASEVGLVPLGSRPPCQAVLLTVCTRATSLALGMCSAFCSPDSLCQPVLVHYPNTLKLASHSPG